MHASLFQRMRILKSSKSIFTYGTSCFTQRKWNKLVPEIGTSSCNTEGEQERNDRGIQRAVNCLFVILEMESKEANRKRADSM